MPQASGHPVDLKDFAGFLHATTVLASPSLVLCPRGTEEPPSQAKGVATIKGSSSVIGVSEAADPRAIELGVIARRLAEVVLSACDDEDLAEAMGEAFALDEFQKYCELRMGLMFSLRDPVDDPLLPLEVREAMLASCYTILAILARDVAIVDSREIPEWLSASLDRFARSGLEAVKRLPEQDSREYAAMLNERDERERRIESLRLRAAESGQAVFWPFGEPADD